MKTTLKKVISVLVIVVFLMSIVSGAFAMIHDADGRMQGDCPFSSGESVDCIQNTLTSATHRVSFYKSFLNVTTDYSSVFLLVSLLFITSFYKFLKDKDLPDILPGKKFYIPPHVTAIFRKVFRWLSLFENSPSNYINA